MSEYELQNAINSLNEDVRILKLKKTKYENMNKKIIEVIRQLTEANIYATKAYTTMKTYYKSMVKAKEDRDFEEISTEINKQLNQLRQVNQSSNEQIEKINYQINEKNNSINSYQNQLTNMINARIAAERAAEMATLNTTEFYSNTSYNGPSIVDALNSAGIDSTYSNRKLIAEANGITNYRGTAEQNIHLLDLFKNEELKK